jgi:putative membrane protein
VNAKIVITLGSSILAVAACGHNNQAAEENLTNIEAANTNAGTTTAAASADQAFANTAAASDAFEIQSSQLAASNASSKAVKAFAQRMIEAHTASTAKLKSAAASASPAITPDPTLSTDQQQKLDQLKSQSGAAFDSAYIDEQITAHQTALDGLRNYSAGGTVPALKSFATQMTPTVAAHLNMAKALKH